MKKMMKAQIAGKILLGTFALMLILNVLIVMQVVPSNIAMGGQVKDDKSNLVQIGVVAITLNLVFAGIVAGKLNALKQGKRNKVINVGTWIVFLNLIVNTLGNFASGVSAETMFFGPLTIVMAFCALRLALEK